MFFFLKKGINKHNKLPNIHFRATPVSLLIFLVPELIESGINSHPAYEFCWPGVHFFHLLPLTPLRLFLFLFFFEAESHTMAQTVLKLTTMLLSQPPKCQKYKRQSMSLKIVTISFSLFASRVPAL